jgi:hypothetical protein
MYETVSTVTLPDGREIIKIERMECVHGCGKLGCYHSYLGVPSSTHYRDREGRLVNEWGELTYASQPLCHGQRGEFIKKDPDSPLVTVERNGLSCVVS